LFFKRKYEVTDETQDWIIDSFEWAIRHRLLTADTPLVLPTKEFFSAPAGSSPETVQTVVNDLKRLLKLDEENIKVLPLESQLEEHRHEYGKLSDIAETWQGDDEQALIRYDPSHAARPIPFIATLTHELMHHRLHGIEEYPPGGPEAEELSTDLHCITTGFGVFQLTGAETIGWQGYMRQPYRAHAFALFLAIRDIAPETALNHLTPRAAKSLRRANKEIADQSSIVTSLRDFMQRQ
jgi:hypothetical protein